MSQPLNRLDLLRLVFEDQRLQPGQTVHFTTRRRVGERLVNVEAWGKAVAVRKDVVTVLWKGERVEVPRFCNPDWQWEGGGMLPSEQSSADDTVPLGEV